MESIMVQWQRLSFEEQQAIVKAGVFSKAREHYGIEVLWKYGYELDDYINATWERVLDPDRLAKVEKDRREAGKPQITLAGFVFTMANAAISDLVNQHRRHANRSAGEVDPELQAVNDKAEYIITMVDLKRFIQEQDERNQKIIEMVSQGYTEREMGKALDISGPAVHKRITKLRGELLKAIG